MQKAVIVESVSKYQLPIDLLRKAFRAVALTNGANQFAIVISFHRVINSNGDQGGYGGGIKRKEWLLKHERK